jgi:hypothetical protein
MSPSERHKAEALSILNEIKDKRCAYNDKKKQEQKLERLEYENNN